MDNEREKNEGERVLLRFRTLVRGLVNIVGCDWRIYIFIYIYVYDLCPDERRKSPIHASILFELAPHSRSVRSPDAHAPV